MLIKLVYVLVDSVNLMRGLLHWLMNWVHLWIYEWIGWVDWDLLERFKKWKWLGLVRYIGLLVKAMIKWADQLGGLIKCNWRITGIVNRWVGGCINMHISCTVATRLTLCSPHLNCSLILHSQRVCHMWYSFFWVFPRRLHFMCWRFETLCSIFIVRVNTIFLLGKSPTSCSQEYEDGIECSETSAYKIQASGNHPRERKQQSQHGGSLKSWTIRLPHIHIGDGKPNTTVVGTGNTHSYCIVSHGYKFRSFRVRLVSTLSWKATEFVLRSDGGFLSAATQKTVAVQIESST